VVDQRRQGLLSYLVGEPARSHASVQRAPPAIVIPSPVERIADETQERTLVDLFGVTIVVQRDHEVAGLLGGKVIAERTNAV